MPGRRSPARCSARDRAGRRGGISVPSGLGIDDGRAVGQARRPRRQGGRLVTGGHRIVHGGRLVSGNTGSGATTGGLGSPSRDHPGPRTPSGSTRRRVRADRGVGTCGRTVRKPSAAPVHGRGGTSVPFLRSLAADAACRGTGRDRLHFDRGSARCRIRGHLASESGVPKRVRLCSLGIRSPALDHRISG